MTTTSNSSTSSTTPPNSKSGSMKRTATMSITKELEDNVSNLLGPSSKIVFKVMLKLELKADKLENRLLVFTAYRFFVFTVKGSPKLEHSLSYLDISSIESRHTNRLVVGTLGDSRQFAFQSVDPNHEEVNMIITHLITTLKTLFPHTPLEWFVRKLDVEPRTRLEPIFDYVQAIEEKARFRLLDLPCGGFSNQYSCFCDYHGIPFREEVAWDIDTIYSAHCNTELSILDFEHLDLKDMVPIIAALAYNGWFTKFRVSNVRLVASGQSSGSEQICEQIVNLVRRSVTLEEIFLDNTGVRADFVNKMFAGMLLNNQTAIRVIDLSNNPIEDKGLKSMTAFIAKSFHMANAINVGSSNMTSSNDDLSSSLSLNFSVNSITQQHSMSMSSVTNGGAGGVSGPAQPPQSTTSAKLMYKGLLHLNLSHCAITSKGICELSESLYLNKSMFSTLTYLNLSDNFFKDDLTKLYNFLAQPNNLSHLDLSGTDCNLESVFGALLHGCTNNLVHLNLSRNQFSSKKSSHKDLVVPAAIKKFFSTAIFLRTLNLSNNRLPPEALKAVLLGLACNESATDIRINLSSNEFKSNGAAVLELALTDIRCVSGLDLSDNSLDMDLIGVVNAISKNKALKFLSIGRNFGNIKAKHMPKVLDAFVQLLQEVDCSIESLSLVDSKLRSETSIILNALGSNQSLVNIDVSGNMMGLAGAKTLAKALQVNNRLETIYLDRNFIPTAGFIDIAYALERNFTLKYLPVPVQDVQTAMIKMADRTEAAITKIQEYIRRNNLPQTGTMRNLRLLSLAQSNFAIDTNLFTQIERISYQLQQLLAAHVGRMKPFDASSNRIPSVDSIDINLSGGSGGGCSEQTTDQTLIADHGVVADEYSLAAEALLRDANNARHLCAKIQEIYSNSPAITTAATSGTMNGITSSYFASSDAQFGNGCGRFSTIATITRPIEANILEFAKELKRTFEAQIVTLSESMILCAREEFPQLFAQNRHLELELKELYRCLLSGGGGGAENSFNSRIPSIEYFHACLTDHACATWSVKLEQILHAVASQMCNKLLHEISRSLSNAQKLLANSVADSKSLDFAAFAGGNNNQHHQQQPQPHQQSYLRNNNQNNLHSNGTLNSARSLTPDVLRTRVCIDSSSSHESAEMNSSNNNGQMLDVDGNNAIATPKLQNQKRQNVYIRKLRPQSVLDGAIANDDFPDLLVKAPLLQSTGDSSLFGDANNRHQNVVTSVQHLTKMRPRVRKTRAPTRVALLDSKSLELNGNSAPTASVVAKLDEGLDSFFPSAPAPIIISSFANKCSSSSSMDSLDGKDIATASLPTIKETSTNKASHHVQHQVNNGKNGNNNSNSNSIQKPQPQPRKILRKFGFKQASESSASSPAVSSSPMTMSCDAKSSSTSSSSSSSSSSTTSAAVASTAALLNDTQSIVTQNSITLKNEDFIRSASPTYFGKRFEHVSICSEPLDSGPGPAAVPTATANPSTASGRTAGSCSPLPPAIGAGSGGDFLAEIRAKQERRSHGSTPLNEQITFAGTLEAAATAVGTSTSGKTRTSPTAEHQFAPDKPLPPEPPNNNTGSNSSSSSSSGSNNSISVAKRATMFGELHKSPSKASINQACSFGNNNNNNNNNGCTSVDDSSSNIFANISIVSSNGNSASTNTSTQSQPQPPHPVKQRPKSMVGILGAKFELSLMNSSGGNK